MEVRAYPYGDIFSACVGILGWRLGRSLSAAAAAVAAAAAPGRGGGGKVPKNMQYLLYLMKTIFIGKSPCGLPTARTNFYT